MLGLIFVAASAVAQPVLTVVGSDGKPVHLSPTDAARVVQKVEEVVVSANFNSRDHPASYFGGKVVWRPLSEIRKGPHIQIAYPEGHRFKTIGGTLSASSVWVDLPQAPTRSGGAVYPGPITLSDGKESVFLTKESGYLLLGLGLDPALYPHLPKIIQENMDACRNAYETFKKKDRS